MAKWYPTAAVADIRGKIGNWIFSYQKGVHYIRAWAAPAQPNTPAQANVKQVFSMLTGEWYSLPEVYKEMWEKYASLTGRVDGLRAFLAVNLFIYLSGATGYQRIDWPPPPGDRPGAVAGFEVQAVSSVQNVVSWNKPKSSDTYVQVAIQFDWNYYSGYNQHWKLLGATLSTAGQYVHSHDTPPGKRIWYKLRAFKLNAKRTPWTHVIKITVPSSP
ncbi:MAG TPA: hypothetical protein EYP19_10685 [Desulfobacterales bacterium]|nr:hypothetical protein [Desulfobacterales bacterium]